MEYEHQLEKIFGDKTAFSEKTTFIFMLQDNTTTSNNIFDPQLLPQTSD